MIVIIKFDNGNDYVLIVLRWWW